MAKMNPMVSMELDDEDSLDFPCPMPGVEKPKYPYNLCIALTDKEMAKLDLDPSEAFVGGTIHLHALGTITGVSMNQNQDSDPTCRIEIQLVALCVESEDEENASYD